MTKKTVTSKGHRLALVGFGDKWWVMHTVKAVQDAVPDPEDMKSTEFDTYEAALAFYEDFEKTH